MNISVLRIYEYIKYISMGILTQNIGDIKINENSKNLKKNSKKNI